MQKQLKILGIAAIVLGVLAALLCALPYGIVLALPTGFLGMIASTIYVYMDTKHGINQKKFTAGIIGLILSSIPIVLVLVIIIISRFK